MFEDPDTNASVAIGLHLIPDDGTFDRCDLTFYWSIQESNNDTNRGRKFHPPRQPQVKTCGAYVVDKAIEAEGLFVDIDAPNSRRQSIAGSRLGAPFNDLRAPAKCRFGGREMAIKNVVCSLFALHMGGLATTVFD